eukprot:821601-Amphidinium_carterae.1
MECVTLRFTLRAILELPEELLEPSQCWKIIEVHARMVHPTPAQPREQLPIWQRSKNKSTSSFAPQQAAVKEFLFATRRAAKYTNHYVVIVDVVVLVDVVNTVNDVSHRC